LRSERRARRDQPTRFQCDGHSQAVGYRWLPRPFHGDRVSSKPSVGPELLRRISHR
jgi:hypothetical protein